jgi:hypothetical protein
MWGRKSKSRAAAEASETANPYPLKEALREVRIEAAERTGVVVEMRDAEAVRLELLNDALNPIFAEIPVEVEIFDRGVSRGDVPRLWIDIIAYVIMGRDKRTYRFVQDTRYGRKILFESTDIPQTAKAVTRYVAGRLIERERALSEDASQPARKPRRGGWFWRAVAAFALGFIGGIAALIIVALLQNGG